MTSREGTTDEEEGVSLVHSTTSATSSSASASPSSSSAAVASSAPAPVPRVKGIVLNSSLDVSRPQRPPIRVVLFSPGDHQRPRYIGQEVGGKPHGRGKCFYKSGAIYDGGWENGKRHGYGELRRPLKDAQRNGVYEGAFYAGHWKCGRRHGFGVQFYSLRSWYEGQWSEGAAAGWGRRVYADGSSYEGGWMAGRRDGVGLYKDAKGGRFEGIWKNDVREGPGRQWLSKSGAVIQGRWASGTLKEGTYTTTPS